MTRTASLDRARIGWAATVGAVLFAIAIQIVYPLTGGSTRDVVTILVVAASATASLLHACTTLGVRAAAFLLICVAGIGGIAETIGLATGMPFGCYEYAVERLGPTLIGVPLVVAAAWWAGFYPITWIAHRTIGRSWLRIVVSALAMTGWDLYLDPQMVADGMWAWCSTAATLPGLPNIPYTNFLGWLLVAGLIALAVDRAPIPPAQAGGTRIDVAPLTQFCWTWLGSALAHAVFLDTDAMGWSWAYGLLGMGVLAPALAGLRPQPAPPTTPSDRAVHPRSH